MIDESVPLVISAVRDGEKVIVTALIIREVSGRPTYHQAQNPLLHLQHLLISI
jgi:hypothetical protein